MGSIPTRLRRSLSSGRRHRQESTRGLATGTISARLILSAVALAAPLVTGSCFRPGALEDVPARAQTDWRPLRQEERDAVRRRLADEQIDIRESDLDTIRIPAKETPYLDWSHAWSFRGAEIHVEFRLVRFRRAQSEVAWPASFTIARLPSVDPAGLLWEPGSEPRPSSLGTVRYHWDLYVPDVIATKHCSFYERQYDRHERRHMFYAERLVRRLQGDGLDFASRLLGAPHGSSGSPADPSPAETGAFEARRAAFLDGEARRFVEELPLMRNRYWSPKDEEAQVVKETLVSDADREDLEANCLVHPDTP